MGVNNDKEMVSVLISIQDFSGDTKLKLTWDKNDPKSIKLAKEEFRRLKEAGYTIFSVKKVLGLFPKKGKEVKSYDPKLGAIYYSKEEKKSAPLDELDSFTMEEFVLDVGSKEEETKEAVGVDVKLEDVRLYDPEKDDLDSHRDYVATSQLRAG